MRHDRHDRIRCHVSQAALYGVFIALCAYSAFTMFLSVDLVSHVPSEMHSLLTIRGHNKAVYPHGKKVFAGLDARRVSHLTPLLTHLPTDLSNFYIRSEAPDGILDFDASRWNVSFLTQNGDLERNMSALWLQQHARKCGSTVMECAGNSRAFDQGLMSVAEWHGVPLGELMTISTPFVEITGDDSHSQASHPPKGFALSHTGASWILSKEDVAESGAFLATHMNGQVLSRDHGMPVRLVLPGWYGCTHIKWVRTVQARALSTRASSQMTEFAKRTHQIVPTPLYARDFRPAHIPHSAAIVRASRQGRSVRLEGLKWGGWPRGRDVCSLEIQCGGPKAPFRTVSSCVLVDAPVDFARFQHHCFIPKKRTALMKVSFRMAVSSEHNWKMEQGYFDRSVALDSSDGIQRDVAHVHRITTEALLALINADQGHVVIDVCTQSEHDGESGNLFPTAHVAPFTDPSQFVRRIESLAPDVRPSLPVYLFCRAGRHAHTAAQVLVDLAHFQQVYYVQD